MEAPGWFALLSLFTASLLAPLALRWWDLRHRSAEQVADDRIESERLQLVKEKTIYEQAVDMAERRREENEELRGRVAALEVTVLEMQGEIRILRRFKAGAYLLYYQAVAAGLEPAFNPEEGGAGPE